MTRITVGMLMMVIMTLLLIRGIMMGMKWWIVIVVSECPCRITQLQALLPTPPATAA